MSTNLEILGARGGPICLVPVPGTALLTAIVGPGGRGTWHCGHPCARVAAAGAWRKRGSAQVWARDRSDTKLRHGHLLPPRWHQGALSATWEARKRLDRPCNGRPADFQDRVSWQYSPSFVNLASVYASLSPGAQHRGRGLGSSHRLWAVLPTPLRNFSRGSILLIVQGWFVTPKPPTYNRSSPGAST